MKPMPGSHRNRHLAVPPRPLLLWLVDSEGAAEPVIGEDRDGKRCHAYVLSSAQVNGTGGFRHPVFPEHFREYAKKHGLTLQLRSPRWRPQYLRSSTLELDEAA